MKKIIVIILCFTCYFNYSQDSVQLKSEVRHTLDELRDFVAIPNDAMDLADINRNITWLTQKFNERGFNTSVLPTDGAPLFFAALPMEDNKPTILLYMHMDGQPVDPSQWQQTNPYTMVLKAPKGDGWKDLAYEKLNNDINYDWRVFGRSTSDDKGPIVMFLNAIDLLKKENKEIPFNIKVVIDSEEEKGSKPLAKAVKEYKELLQADFLVINDGPVHSSGNPTILYGCRGITTLTLTTYGPIKPLHSGHYGNYIPNPALSLSQALTGMKDMDGKVTIPGYYDGISLDDATMAILKSVPDNESQLKEDVEIKTTDKVGNFYQEALQYPSLNIRGMSSGWVGTKARTIIPATATADLDIRLVPETDGNRLKSLIKTYLEKQGFYIIDKTPTKEERLSHGKIMTVQEGSITKAFQTDMNNPYGQFLTRVLKNTFEKDVVQIRMMGGTVPIAPFVNELKIPAFIVPLVNPDNNQHSPNENLKIGQIAYGIKAFYGILGTDIK